MRARIIRAIGAHCTLIVGIGMGFILGRYVTNPHRLALLIVISIAPLAIASSVGLWGELMDRGS